MLVLVVDKDPDAFRNISEVSETLKVPTHVLRFWETRFSQIKPIKRSGGRRYYRPADIHLLTRIRDLLYRQGYTIKGAQLVLRQNRSGDDETTSSISAENPVVVASSAHEQAMLLLQEAKSRLEKLTV